MNRVSRWFVNRDGRRRAARLLARVRPVLGLPASASILELGAGAGALSVLLHETYPDARLTVTDFDPYQVEAARSAFVRRFGAVPPGVEVRPADASALPFADGAFDAVFAIMMLHHVERRHSDYQLRPVVLPGVRRVVAPGGWLVWMDFSRTDEMEATFRGLGLDVTLARRQWPRSVVEVMHAPLGPAGETRGRDAPAPPLGVRSVGG